MIVKKAGSVLLNLQTKQIGLVYRENLNDYSFPKGHLENGETLAECAVRETEEETMRKVHLLVNKEIYVSKYISSKDENSEVYMYICIDDGPVDRDIALIDREVMKWTNFDDVENTLSYNDLKEFWNKIKEPIKVLLEDNNVSPSDILTKLNI